MVACEKKTALMKQYTMSLSMTGGWDCQEARRQFSGFVAVQHDLGVGLGRQLGAVDNTAGPEFGSVTGCVGDVVAVSEENVGDAA
jgi:hypothetical protein